MLATPIPTGSPVGLDVALEHSVLWPAGRIGIELMPIGVTGVPSKPVIAIVGQRPWYFNNYIDDLTARRFGGRIPVPAAVHSRLMALRDVGVVATDVWLGHELPLGWTPEQEIPDLVPSSYVAVEGSHVQIDGRAVAVEVIRRIERSITAAGRTLRETTRGLDPIVLAGVRDATGTAVAWGRACALDLVTRGAARSDPICRAAGAARRPDR